MKQLIKEGTSVDVGDGDNLRDGAIKINANFNDIYNELGDTQTLYSAGAWKIIADKDLKAGVYNPKYGQSLILDSTKQAIKIHLPKGGVEHLGKVIKLRDIFGSWLKRPIQIKPYSGDTIKGVTGYTKIHRNFSNIELVYMANNRWEYVETTQLDQHRSSDLRSVIMSEHIATEGQTDFEAPFGVDRYNPTGIEVYRRGNRLFYGTEFLNQSEYGSIGKKGELIALDGLTIKLRHPCKEGDTIAFTSYIDGIETFRTSKTKRPYKIVDTDISTQTEFNENDIQVDSTRYETDDLTDTKYITIPISELGIESYDNLNPYALDIYLNGVLLSAMDDVEDGKYFCLGVDGDINSPMTCQIKGGDWIPLQRMGDYNYVYEGSSVSALQFNFVFEHEDLLTLNWYNNIIGTTLTVDEIRSEMDSSFINSVDEFHLINKVSIPDYEDIEGLPNQKYVKYDNKEELVRPNSASQILELVYPVGHVWMNLYNKESPEHIIGFGKWRQMSGHVVAGFNDDYTDNIFGQNNNFLDSAGNPTPTPGGTYGSLAHTLSPPNIPKQTTEGKYLMKDVDGDVDIGSCLIDPESEETHSRKYKEQTISLGVESGLVEEISNMQPTIIVSMWVRVA